jgi:hypothetical protein
MKTRQFNQVSTRNPVLAALGRLVIAQVLVLSQTLGHGSAQTVVKRPPIASGAPRATAPGAGYVPAPPPNPAGPLANVQPAFPIAGSQDDCFAASGGCMHTDVNITKNADGSGHLNAVTRTSERTMFRGFRGSVAVAVLDANRNKLWVSKTLTYGVDGTMVGTHDRTENWTDTVPAQLVPHVRYFAIIQKWNPNSVYNDINNWLQGIKTVADVLGPIIKSVTTVAKG